MTLARHLPDSHFVRNVFRRIGYQAGNFRHDYSLGHDQFHLDHIDLTVCFAAGEGFRRAQPQPDKVSDVLDLADMGDEDFRHRNRLGERPRGFRRTHEQLRHGYAAYTRRALPKSLHRQPGIVPSGQTLNFASVETLRVA